MSRSRGHHRASTRPRATPKNEAARSTHVCAASCTRMAASSHPRYISKHARPPTRPFPGCSRHFRLRSGPNHAAQHCDGGHGYGGRWERLRVVACVRAGGDGALFLSGYVAWRAGVRERRDVMGGVRLSGHDARCLERSLTPVRRAG